jgi:cyclophilin family peptidyl-prolyl cis-trans isomerase
VRAALTLLVIVVALASAGCGGDDAAAPEPRDPGQHEAPSEPLPAGKTYALTFDTSHGSFTVTLDTERAPNTSASLVALTRDGYFDDTIFHRIVPGFVIQGGDPSQTGSGGPGYTTVDAPPADASAYTKGTVAMAKSPDQPPGAGGSQFFVVTSNAAASALTPDYAIVGEVTEGLDVVEHIGTLGDESQQPTEPVVIRTVTVAES